MEGVLRMKAAWVVVSVVTVIVILAGLTVVLSQGKGRKTLQESKASHGTAKEQLLGLTFEQEVAAAAAAGSMPKSRSGPTLKEKQIGYLLSVRYWEQLTSGSRNMLSLQCWGGRLGMSVVEPFVRDTKLYSPSDNRVRQTSLRFSDIYDIDYWNELSSKMKSLPLTPWEQFLSRAPRKLITVNIQYASSEAEDVKEGCTKKDFLDNMVKFLKQKHKFKVVRTVCINLPRDRVLSVREFRRKVFNGKKWRSNTVLFSEWRGMSTSGMRLHVNDNECRLPAASLDAEPSKRVLQDAEKYRKMYLKVDKYMGLVARIEKVQNGDGDGVANCLQETLKEWRKIVAETGLSITFLSVDIGKYGSRSLQASRDDLDSAREFFASIYGNRSSIRQWEESFERVSGTTHPGYIGVLQKAIAANARCMLFVGGGSFQSNALQLYRRKHSRKDWCIHTVEGCIRKFDLFA